MLVFFMPSSKGSFDDVLKTLWNLARGNLKTVYVWASFYFDAVFHYNSYVEKDIKMFVAFLNGNVTREWSQLWQKLL